MWPFKRKQFKRSPEPRATVVELPHQSPDHPRGFGFKTTWWALPTTDNETVVSAIGLQNAQPANWQTGIQYAYKKFVFVTPPVAGWTLITGWTLPPTSQNARAEVLAPLLNLSQSFGTALVFATHRVVEYHVWAKAISGSLIRGYGYLGESGETFWGEGDMTPEEQSLGFAFFNERSADAVDDSYWNRDDLDYPDEMKVMAIAREWSVSPSKLEDYKRKEPSLGVLGSHCELLKQDGFDNRFELSERQRHRRYHPNRDLVAANPGFSFVFGPQTIQGLSGASDHRMAPLLAEVRLPNDGNADRHPLTRKSASGRRFRPGFRF